MGKVTLSHKFLFAVKVYPQRNKYIIKVSKKTLKELTMNKNQLVNYARQITGATTEETQKHLNAILDAITYALKNDDDVTLVGFGSFKVKERKEKQGTNPSSGKKMTIPSKNVVYFKPGKKMEEALNDK